MVDGTSEADGEPTASLLLLCLELSEETLPESLLEGRDTEEGPPTLIDPGTDGVPTDPDLLRDRVEAGCFRIFLAL